MALDMDSRSAGGLTLRMMREHQKDQAYQERQKYCYPFKEYDPTALASSTSRMSQQNAKTAQDPFQRLNGLRRATISQGTGHKFLDPGQGSDQIEAHHQDHQDQNVPPLPVENKNEPPPLPPRRTTSLIGGGTTMTLLRLPKARESSSLNPKRISIATSTFWNGHPDMAHFASGWELGKDSMRTHSVWGTTERGGRPVTESVDIWGDPPAVKKGVLLQQREKLWSRWKERYFILTRDYLNCFRRTTSVHRSGVRLSEMGSYIYKLRLAEVDLVEWETRKNGSLIVLVLPQEPRILLRVPEENYETLHQWYTLLQECIYMSKERRRALRSQHGSMQRSTTSYNPNSNKSVGSASPNSSSKSTSNSDLEKSDGEKSLQKHSGLLSLRKISGGSTSPKSFLGTGSANRKYSPLIDDDEEDCCEEDYQQAHSQHSTADKGQEEFTITLRRRREINNNPWRSNGHDTMSSRNSGIGPMGKSNVQGNFVHPNTGYSIPVDAQPVRPESWTPQPTVFYRTSSLVPNQWMNKRDLPNGRGVPFGRASVMYCPSRITSDVTFRKMS